MLALAVTDQFCQLAARRCVSQLNHSCTTAVPQLVPQLYLNWPRRLAHPCSTTWGRHCCLQLCCPPVAPGEPSETAEVQSAFSRMHTSWPLHCFTHHTGTLDAEKNLPLQADPMDGLLEVAAGAGTNTHVLTTATEEQEVLDTLHEDDVGACG